MSLSNDARTSGKTPIIPAGQDYPADEDPLGIHAWAGELGIAPATALVLSATTLAHITGPLIFWDYGENLNGMPAPSLLGAESDVLLRAAVARLSSCVVVRQTLLIQGSQEFHQCDVDKAFHVDPRSAPGITSQLRIFRDPSDSSRDDPEALLTAMLDYGRRTVHRENILHPVFMTASLPPGPIEPFLARCNQGHCFVAGGTVNLPVDPTRRHNRVNELIQFIDGAIIQPPQPSVIRAKRVALRGLFLFPQPDIRWLLDHRRDFMRKLIPVSSNPPAPDDPCVFNPDTASRFHARFGKTAVLALARRRACAPVSAAFQNEEARKHFLIRRRRHLLQSANDPTDLTALPDLLIWFLLLIGNDLMDEQVLADLAMDTVEILRHEACRTFALHDELEIGLKRHENAHKILRRIAEQGPMKRHKLVRVFSKQSLGLHAPIIDALLSHGFLREDEERLLHAGARPASLLTVNHLIEIPFANQLTR